MMSSGDLASQVEARFARIRDLVLTLGLTADELASVDAVRTLLPGGNRAETEETTGRRDSGPNSRRRRWLVSGLLVAAAVFAVVIVFQWPVGRADLLAYWFGIPVFALERQRCLVGIDSTALIFDLFRPPVDCSMCRNVTAVDRVSNISSGTFETRYAYSARPVIVTDAMDDWAALKAFSFEFFRRIYTDDSPVLTSDSNCQFFPYKTDFKNLSEVFQMSDDRARMSDGSEPWYIGWSNCDSIAANILRTYYKRPYFLPDLAESSKTDWIFMGSPGYGAQMHVDNVVNPSWQAQVIGTKLWVLEPPPECYFECQAQVKVHVRPGEIIVLDTNKWYHSTYITGSEMSITIGSEFD